MSGQVRVAWPYVPIKVKNPIGSGVNVLGYYEGAVLNVDDLDPDDLERLKNKGAMEDVKSEVPMVDDEGDAPDPEDVQKSEQDHAAEEAEFSEVMAGNADGVRDWVGDDPAKARKALDTETGPDGKNRSTLVAHLSAVAASSDNG